jgi:hypothetical protein
MIFRFRNDSTGKVVKGQSTSIPRNARKMADRLSASLGADITILSIPDSNSVR